MNLIYFIIFIVIPILVAVVITIKMNKNEKPDQNYKSNEKKMDTNLNELPKHSELKTWSRTAGQKFAGGLQMFFGFIILLTGVVTFAYGFTSRKVGDLRGLGVILFLIGMVVFFLGAQKYSKARFIAWVIEALERYERIKHKNYLTLDNQGSEPKEDALCKHIDEKGSYCTQCGIKL